MVGSTADHRNIRKMSFLFPTCDPYIAKLICSTNALAASLSIPLTSQLQTGQSNVMISQRGFFRDLIIGVSGDDSLYVSCIPLSLLLMCCCFDKPVHSLSPQCSRMMHIIVLH